MNGRLASLALFLASIAAVVVRADDIQDFRGMLDTNVVTAASQTAETDDVAPAISSNITGADLRRYGIHTLEEAVNFLSFAVTSGGRNFHGRPAELSARGVGIAGDQGNHVLVLVNGHHVNEPGLGTVRVDRVAAIPLELVDHIEVVVGPGSVLYGTNAMLGVINVVTKRAADYAGSHAVLEGGITPSVRAGASAGYEFEFAGEPTEVIAAVEYFEQHGPSLHVEQQNLGTDTFGNVFRTHAEGPATGLWGGTISHANRLRVPSAFAQIRMGDWTLSMHGKLARVGWLNAVSFDRPENRVDEQSGWTDLTYTKLLSSVVDFTARAYADGFGERNQQLGLSGGSCQNQEPCRHRVTRTTRWIGLELRTSLDWLENKTLLTIVGADGRLRDVRRVTDFYETDSDVVKVPSVGVMSRQDLVFGTYLQQIYKPTHWLGLNAGVRLDYDSRFSPVFTPRVAAVSELWAGAKARLAYAEAFRAPGFLETHLAAGQNIKAHLHPETVRSVELSVDQRLGVHRFILGGFWSAWSGLVSTVVLSEEQRIAIIGKALSDLLGPATTSVQLQNLSDINSVGLNAGYEGSAIEGALTFALNATLARSRQQAAGAGAQAMPTAPRLFGNMRIAYELPAPLPTLAVAAHYLDRRPAEHAFDGGFTPIPYAPAQLELRATLTGAIGDSGLSYRLIGNYAFATRGPYLVGPRERATLTNQIAALNPIEQFELYGGLQYDIP